ncbi:N-acetylmuramoyl-L-alanine amidase [Porphyrobacter sp. AAP60]|uniref:N-acetylmuramoyl-L-alanine amidase n=1 Tax=Porphyrobacter sp. AAP60 TaxID=1523423 RepID=UPI0006B961DA|nr:N-acetylmuramoyl-L-alanine amidase [Porphyrobacter sp. AAP60]KPF62901.1 N-acetylmuramoyl-L-alanine amidase [Porphyrobacter sp. AAP60]
MSGGIEGDELVHREVPSPNYGPRTLPISMVVLHYTEMKPVEAAIARMCDPAASVSAHYCITEEGEVIRLVAENRRAWHAGASFWRGIPDVNSASIGIELDHPGHGLGYRPFAEAQIDALIPLLARIVRRYDIPRANVVGHSDVAPMRKVDPGELFPWDRIAEYNLCLPRPASLAAGNPFHNDGSFFMALERFGYDITDQAKAVEAFERRWRPHRITGVPDGEIAAILWQLLIDRDEGRTR